MKKPNHESIYLIPGSYDGEHCYVWSDDPAQGAEDDPADAIEYVRADLVPASNEVLAKRIAELTNERDAALAQLASKTDIANQLKDGLAESFEKRMALQAQVEQLRDLLIRVVKCEEYIFDSDLIVAVGSDLQSEISEALDATPAQCLAEIKARAVEVEACEWLHNNYPKLSDPVCGLLAARANQIRQQAKAGSSE